jgi:hypothetical protein
MNHNTSLRNPETSQEVSVPQKNTNSKTAALNPAKGATSVSL